MTKKKQIILKKDLFLVIFDFFYNFNYNSATALRYKYTVLLTYLAYI
ncbi:hypothetical protein WVIC16_130237 [Weissella viridescens]|nr:hypothetical protein WVIC16_130237 [Weissella viridescens]